MIDFKGWFTHIAKQYRTHQNADLSLDEHWEKYQDRFKKITIGCSFAPDLVEQMYLLENGVKNVSVEQKLAVLKVLIHEFGLKDIRLGIKWNKVVDAHGKFDFSYYHPFLDYCLTHDVQICLNVGPIKTFGWPEEHIPKQIIDKSSLILGSKIYFNSEMAKNALAYLDILLLHLKSSYSKEQLKNMVIIQPENEQFNIYGKLKLRLSEEYISQVIKKIYAIFPDKKILLSSAETRNTFQIAKFIKKIINEEKINGSNFICGINYYYNLPHYIHLPKIGPIDYITYSNFVQRKTNYANIRTARKLGYQIEVTEAQFEQWGRAHLSPGNSFHEAKYLFARIAENILDPQEGGLIRLWGLERYAKKKIENSLTQDHKDNLKLIQRINRK